MLVGFLDRLSRNEFAWPNRRPGWSAAGWAILGTGLVLSLAGWLAAFSVVGAILLFVGSVAAVAGLALLLGQRPWAWTPLVCAGCLVLLWIASGVAHLVN